MTTNISNLPQSSGLNLLPGWRTFTLRTKLVIAFLAVTIIPLAIVGFITYNSSRSALTNAANEKIASAASTTAQEIDAFIKFNLENVRAAGQFPAVLDFLALPASQRAGSEEEARLQKFVTAMSRQDPIFISSVAIYDINGITLADTFSADIGVDKSDRTYFQNTIQTGLPNASDVENSASTSVPSIYFAAPTHDATGKIIGLIRIRYNAAILQKLIVNNTGLAGESSYAVLLDSNNIRLAHGIDRDRVYKSVVPLDAALVADLQAKGLLPAGTPQELGTNLPDFENGLNNISKIPFFAADTNGDGGLEEVTAAPLTTKNWSVAFVQSQSIFLAPITTQTFNNLLATLIVALAVGVVGFLFAQTLAGPIVRLTQTAEAIAGGDINIQAKVETGDEIGTLAGTFNRMTQQLRDFIGTLESRVAERTRNLELAGEVGRTVSQVRALDVMLTDAAELILKQFNLYYVQVYLVNASQTTLDLQAGTGQVGTQLLSRSHRLPFNTSSINGRAAIEKKSVVISDTAESPTFKPNPLLPNTRSEMAVPLMIGERVVGVLDMQSENAGALNQEVLSAFEALAGQLAIAIQNATFLAETEQARAEVEAQAGRLVRANWADYMDAIHKPEETGFVFEQNKIGTLAQAEEIKENALVAAISVTGAALGNLVVEMEGQSPIARTDELINAVARQMSQQIESLRLLDSAERYRAEAEQASRRNTREGWKEYMDANTGESLSYIYDLKEVRLFNENKDQQADESALNLPVKVRDEAVGKLVVQGISADDQDSIDLANAVAERLGAHIESLRQFEETEQRRAEAEILVRELDVQKYALDQHSIVAITDVAGKIIYVNDKFTEISKYSREELLGQDHRILNSGYHPKEFIRNLWVTIANGKVFHGELFNKAKDGSNYWVDTTIVPILNVEGKPERYLAIRTDITQRKYDEEINIKRAAELDTVAEISTVAASILNAQEMLDAVVNLTKERFNLYHTHVYLMDDKGENLVLASGAGEIGKQMVAGKRSLPLSGEHSLVARAARTGKGAISNDVTKEQDFLPNPLLPDTLSEMAVPMIVGTKVIGVFDVQGNIINRFTEEDIRIKTTLATQVGTALQNARTFAQAQQQAERESTLNLISQKIQGATSVEAVLQIAARELGRALDAPLTIAQLGMGAGVKERSNGN